MIEYLVVHWLQIIIFTWILSLITFIYSLQAMWSETWAEVYVGVWILAHAGIIIGLILLGIYWLIGLAVV